MRRRGKATPVSPCRSRPGGAGSGGVPASTGNLTTNSLPVPGPPLWAVIVPPCIPTSVRTRPKADAQAALGVGPVLADLDEHLEQAGEHLGGDADARVPHPDDDLIPPP